MTIKTITTVDGINVVDFGNTINEYYWFKNLGDTTIYVSNKEDFKAGDDGVSELTVTGDVTNIETHAGKVYILGSGKVEIHNTDSKLLPFKSAPVAGGGGGASYSTEEKIIGEWIDGKTVYRKVIDMGTNFAITSGADHTIPTELIPENLLTIIKACFLVRDSNYEAVLPIEFFKDKSDSSYKYSYFNSWDAGSGRRVFLILEYTKTSD